MVSRQILGQANVNSTELKDFVFPIPPLATQNKIVERIEIMKTEINQAKEQTKELRENAKKEFEAELFGIS